MAVDGGRQAALPIAGYHGLSTSPLWCGLPELLIVIASSIAWLLLSRSEWFLLSWLPAGLARFVDRAAGLSGQ